jgi:hypothetical protein
MCGEEEPTVDLMERTSERRRSFMKDRLENRLDDAMRDKARLEQANELLKEEVDRDAREREQILSAFQKGMRPQHSRFRRFMMLGVGVGAAYVYGAKAGRGRYEEILAWFDKMRGRATELQSDAQRAVSAKTERFTGQAQTAADDVAGSVERASSSTSAKIDTTGRKAADTIRSTAKDATTDPR